MNRSEAWQAIKRLTKEDVMAKTKALGLSKERKELLFNLIQGHTKADVWRQKEIEEFLLKWMEPEVHKLLPPEDHPYSSSSLYEYDPSKNGQNIIKHGLDFGEVVSYSPRFGTLMFPCPDKRDPGRLAMLSDLDLTPAGHDLAMPPSSIKVNGMNYTFSIGQQRGEKFRFISSRLLSTEKKKYRKTIDDTVKDFFTDEKKKVAFVDRCIVIVETQLINPDRIQQHRP